MAKNKIIWLVLVLSLVFSQLVLFLSYRRDKYIERESARYKEAISKTSNKAEIMKATNLFLKNINRPLVDFFQSHAGWALGG